MFKKIISSLMMAFYLAGSLAALTGCNTVSGAGEDIKQGGEKIHEEAEEHK